VRLTAVESGHRWRQKVVLALMRVILRRRVPDIVRTHFYRPELFGRAAAAWTQAVMRGSSSFWSVGERELFAAFISALNRCPF
jgi:hypothetical protein